MEEMRVASCTTAEASDDVFSRVELLCVVDLRLTMLGEAMLVLVAVVSVMSSSLLEATSLARGSRAASSRSQVLREIRLVDDDGSDGTGLFNDSRGKVGRRDDVCLGVCNGQARYDPQPAEGNDQEGQDDWQSWQGAHHAVGCCTGVTRARDEVVVGLISGILLSG